MEDILNSPCNNYNVKWSKVFKPSWAGIKQADSWWAIVIGLGPGFSLIVLAGQSSLETFRSFLSLTVLSVATVMQW